ncbi:MAG: ribosome maturation factor RimM [Acidimicrobiales bacterium]
MPLLLAVGRVTRPHGLQGEVVVDLWTDRAERLDPGMRLESEVGELHVMASRTHGGRYLVRFEGVCDRTRAEALRGLELRAAPMHVDGALWVHELVGAHVVTLTGRDIGTVAALESNPASDLLVLADGALVPLRFVRALEPGVKVTVDVPDGLVD